MSEAETPARAVSDQARDDKVLPFAVEPLDLRGRVVRLGASSTTSSPAMPIRRRSRGSLARPRP